MIVKCDKCQTRFKIPDEKVTEKGVKVRCTKCQNTFRVKKAGAGDDAAAAPAPAAAEASDPFAQFAAPFDDKTRSMSSSPKPTYTAQKHLPSEVFEVPTKVAPIPAAVADAAKSLGLEMSATRTSPAAFAFEPPPPLDLPPSPIDTVPTRQERKPALAKPQKAANGKVPTTLPYGREPEEPPGLLSDVPAFGEEAPASRSPTAWRGATGLDDAMPPPVEHLDLPSEPDRGMFDMPAPPPPARATPQEAPATLGRIKLVQQPAAASGAVSKPSGAPDDVGIQEAASTSAAKKVSGLVLNIGFAAALLMALVTIGGVYLNEGKLELASFSPERLKALVAAPQELVTRDISNGLYDTRAGRPVFYVRGDVENRGDRARRVKVRAEILDGDQLVRAAEGWAGATPSPEDLFALGSKEELEAMNARLEKKAGEVAPKSRAPFVVAFHEYPPALSGLRLKVTVVEGARPTAAR